MEKSFLFIFTLLGILNITDIASDKSSNQTLQPNRKHADTTFKKSTGIKFGDPYILYDKKSSTYFMYGTGGGAKAGFSTYSSSDLINWKDEGQVYFGAMPGAWGIGSFWAPEVYAVNGKYYLFYSAQSKYNPTNELENFKIGVAVADSPRGPFKDISDKPLFEPGYPVIDANLLIDSDGKSYLYYSRCCYKHPVDSEVAREAKRKGWFDEIEESWIYGIEINADFTATVGEPILLLRPPVKLDDKQAEWESRSVTAREVNRRWTEGSVIFKKDNIYYMMYSANHFAGENYAVGYATSDNAFGPFKKSEDNPILQKTTPYGGEISGTGHNSVFHAADGKQMFCVYHARTKATGKERLVFIDRMEVKGGKIRISGPPTASQSLSPGCK